MEITFQLSDNVGDRLSERVSESEFQTLEEYVSFVLNELAKERPELESRPESSEREEKVTDQLRSLGYLE